MQLLPSPAHGVLWPFMAGLSNDASDAGRTASVPYSSPPGPGTNEAGLGLFRYTTPCGYTQWAASTAYGTRSVTTTLNIPAPTGALLERLRDVQGQAVCALPGP